MTGIQDNLFGTLAIRGHFVLPEQINEALALQLRYEQEGRAVPRMGELLASLGYMTPEQVQAVLEGQGHASTHLFGQIATSWKFCSQEDIDSALADQQLVRDQGQRPPRLGEVLVQRGAMKPHQIRAVLHGQGKQIVMCPACGARYNAKNVKVGSRLKCPRCQHLFMPVQPSMDGPRPDDDVRADITVALPAVQVPEHTTAQSLPKMEVGPYQLQQRLGSDHSGVLYKALHPQTGNSVGLRLLSNQIIQGAEEFDLWVSAGQMATELNHPNIQRILSMGSEAGRAYMVMEFIEGKSLRQRLNEQKRLPALEALEILIQIGEALAYGHSRDLIHGDLRPNHILIGLDGRVRLSGLGTPKQVMKDVRLMAEQGGAVPLYIAPEVLIDEENADERSDIYGLAAVGYHMIAGQPPQEGADVLQAALKFASQEVLAPRTLDPGIAPYLNRLLLKGLAAEPDDRFPSVTAFLADLRKCRGGLLIQAPDLPDVAPDVTPGAPRVRKRFSRTHAGRRLRTHWVKTGKTKAVRVGRGSGIRKAIPAARSKHQTPRGGTAVARSGANPAVAAAGARTTTTMPAAQATPAGTTVPQPEGIDIGETLREEIARAAQVEPPAGQVGGALEPAFPEPARRTGAYGVSEPRERRKKRGAQDPNEVSATAIISVILGGAVILLGVLFAFTSGGSRPVKKDAEAVEVKTVEREPRVDLAKQDYETLVTKVIEAKPDDHNAIIRSIDKYLDKHGKSEPAPEQALKARQLRDKHAQQGVALSRAALKEELQALVAGDRYAQAIARVQAWQAEWGKPAEAAAAEEIQVIQDTEKRVAEVEFDRVAQLFEAKKWKEAAQLCDEIAKRFNTRIGARAREERSKIQQAEIGAKVAAQHATAEAEREQEKAEREKQAPQMLAALVKDLREPLASLDLERAKAMIEEASAKLTGTAKGPDYQALKSDLARLEAMRARMTAAAQQGRLRDMRIAYQNDHFGIVDGTSEGPVLDIKGGRVKVKWPELSQDERLEIAKRSMDPANGKHQHELGYYLWQLGQPFPAEKALKAAHSLGESVDTLLEKVRAMQQKVVASREEEAPPFSAGNWEGPDYVKRPLAKQDPVTEKSLGELGWEISKGYWVITGQRTLFGELQDPKLPLVSLKRDLKRFANLTVEMRANGNAIGFSFGKGQRFLVKPSGRWQKLEIAVTGGDLLKFLVDGAETRSLEDTGGAVRSEQLPDYVYVRCEGRLCEVRNFQLDGKSIGAAELPWALVKQSHLPTAQQDADAEKLKNGGWAITEGTWALTPDQTFLAAPKDGVANLQREKPAFRKLSIEFRGEGDAAGFSFGKGMRYLAKPTDKWQQLTVEVIWDDLLRMLIDGNAKASLEDAKGVKAGDLPKVVYLRVQGGPVEFRNYAVDGVPLAAPRTEAQTPAPEAEGPAATQDPEEAGRLNAKGWEIAGGVWKLEADGTLSGAREQGSNLMSLKTKLLRFQELSVEIRGEGDSAGFSFGQGLRWLVPLTGDWQTLQLQLLDNDQFQLLVNGEARNSLEDTAGVVSDRLGEVLYLRAQGTKVQFRNYKAVQAGGGEGGAQAPAPQPQPAVQAQPGAGAGTVEALKQLGWQAAHGTWEVAGDTMKGAIRQGDEVSLKRTWTRGTAVSVEVKGDGYAVGFGWEGDKNIIVRPSDQWQTLRVEVRGESPVLSINGVQRAPLEDVKHIKCDQLGGTLYLRSFGGKVEFRNFKAE